MFYTGNNNTHSLKVVFGSNGADVPGGGTSLNLSGGTAGKFKYALLSGPLTLAVNTSCYDAVSHDQIPNKAKSPKKKGNHGKYRNGPESDTEHPGASVPKLRAINRCPDRCEQAE